MRCPNCDNSELNEKSVKGTEVLVDLCSTCGGIWFDTNELDAVMPSAFENLKPDGDDDYTLRECPRCDEILQCFIYPETDVEVDVCARCSGIWLDAKEFGKISIVRRRMTPEELAREKGECEPQIECLPDYVDSIDEAMNQQPDDTKGKFIPRLEKDRHTKGFRIGKLEIQFLDEKELQKIRRRNAPQSAFIKCPKCRGKQTHCSMCEGRGRVCSTCCRARCWCNSVDFGDPLELQEGYCKYCCRDDKNCPHCTGIWRD